MPAALDDDEDVVAVLTATLQSVAENVSVLTATLEAVADGVLVVDRNGTIVRFNQRMLDLFRISAADVRDHARTLTSLRDQLIRPDSLFGAGRDLYDQPADAIDDVLLCKDGRLLERTSRRQIVKGKSVGRVWTFRDVTARARAQAELAEREARTRAITASAHDAIVVASRDGRVVFWNPAAERMFGCTSDERIDRPLTEILPARYREGQEAACAQLFEGNGRDQPKPTFELHGLRSDGSEFPIELTLSSWSSGNESFVAAIIRDISERKALQEQLVARERLVAMGIISAGVAHEVNNPLAFVKLNQELVAADIDRIADELSAAPEYARLVEDLRNAGRSLSDARDGAERIMVIVQQLRSFTRPEAQARKPVEVPALIESVSKMAQNEIRHRARFEVRFGPTPLVEANDTELGQVFLNLLINAAQAIPAGDADIHCISVVTSTDDGGDCIVEVRDTGSGIQPEHLPRIYEPFFTTKPPGVGTGLGLALVRRIVEGHGGSIHVDSRPGEGTVFRVRLPASGRTERKPIERAKAVVVPTFSASVLVVDDERAIGRAVRRALPACDVEFVSSGHEALRLLSERAFDVVLCDVMMPNLDGLGLYALASKLHPDLANCFVFMTGGTFGPQAQSFLDSTSAPRLDKPFSRADLAKVIESVARATRKRRN